MIFNKSDNGAAEVKETIGFIYASVSFQNLIPYILLAENDLKKLLSKEVFKLIVEHYNSDNYDVPEQEEKALLFNDELVKLCQYPIALLAYKRYAVSSDLSHSDKGRQIFVSQDEKPAFEWQIKRDNQNIINLAHEHIEILLNFLQDSIDNEIPEGDDAYFENPILEAWKNSDAYKKTLKFFINTAEEFSMIYPINDSRRLFLIMNPFIEQEEKHFILPVLGKEKFDEIKAQILQRELADGASDEEIALWNRNVEILELIKEPLALKTMETAIKRLSPEVFPDNYLQSILSDIDLTGKTKTQISNRDNRNEILEHLKNDAENALFKLSEYLLKIKTIDSGEEYIPTDGTERISEDKKFVRL